MTETELMLTSLLSCDRIDLMADPKELTPEQKSRYDQMQSRRTQGEPLQYIIGQTDFMGISLFVDKRVLIPRPETEILVELAIETVGAILPRDTFQMLDLGVGSGNISIALAKNISNAVITAVDISEDALILAAKNVKVNGVADKVKFVCKDMSDYLMEAAAQGKKFDMIISNPPYIPTEQMVQLPEDVQQEPRWALDGREDGLHFHREIIERSYQALATDGFLFMEIGDGQRTGIEAIFAHYPQYRHIQFYKDYATTDRIVMARLNKNF